VFASISKFLWSKVVEPSDDYEALLYLMAFCYNGFNLPWLGAYKKCSKSQFI